MSSLFITVLNMSLTASYVALIVIALRFVLEKARAPKIISYALWVIVLFRLVCPTSFKSSLSLISCKTNGIPHNIVYSQNPAINSGIKIIDSAVNQTIGASLPPVNPAASVNPMGIVIEIAALMWMIGIIVLLSYGVISYFGVKHRLSTATSVKEDLLETDRIQTPFVLGFIKPKTYIPAGLYGKELEYTLKHEQTHIRRYDYIIKPVAFIALVLHWFNPLIWLSYFLMNKDMEMSCDESVMGQSGEDIRVSYSSSLLSLSVKQSNLLTPLAFGESNVKSRIKNILNYKKPRFWAVAAVVAVVAAVATGLMANPKEKDESIFTAERFLKYKTEYVGNASKVGNIISSLNYPEEVKYDFFELHTDSIPYSITVYLKADTETKNYYTGALHEAPFKKNAIIMFSLIDNVGYINFDISDGKNDYLMQYTRDWANDNIGGDVRRYSAGEEEFTQFLRMVEELCTEKEIINLVESFGSKLQKVSLQALKEIAAASIQENYTGLVSNALIEEWKNNPIKAPGRIVSSPWPERIEIQSIERLSQDAYEVIGNIIEITSVEKVSGGIAARRPITLIVKKIDGRWLIDSVTMGEYAS